MLMASAIALQSAPASAFEQMGELKEHLQQQQQSSSSKAPQQNNNTTTTTTTNDRHHNHHHHHERHQDPPPHPPAPQHQPQNHHPPLPISTPFTPLPLPLPPPVQSPISWRSPAIAAAAACSNNSSSGSSGGGGGGGTGLTLESLRRLAAALSPADGPELTPVQAWFEIARTRGRAAALDPALMDVVRRGLAREVRCVQFGAVVRRDVFDEVVRRVFGRGGGGGVSGSREELVVQ